MAHEKTNHVLNHHVSAFPHHNLCEKGTDLSHPPGIHVVPATILNHLLGKVHIDALVVQQVMYYMGNTHNRVSILDCFICVDS